MMEKKTLPVLLLSPWLIGEGSPAISLLRIVKKDKLVSYSTNDLAWPLVRKEFRDFPRPAKDILMDCCAEALEETRQHIRQRHALQRGVIDFDLFLTKNIIQHWYKMLEGFKPYLSLVKWYYRKPKQGTKHYITAPCSFSKLRPSLSFDVVKEGAVFGLKINVGIGSEVYPLELFHRTCFLLESKGEFFVLSHTDYLAIEHVQQMDMSPFVHDAELFSRNVLAALETNYPVNRHHFFAKTQIEVQPVNRLFLTELNNAFLMLTPQWLYEGNVTEGPWKESFEVLKEGATHVIKRNQEAESSFLQTLVSLHPNFCNQRNGYYYLSFADAQKKQWFLKVYHQLLQMDIEIVGMDMLQHFRYSPHKPEINIKLLKEDDNRLEYEVEVAFGKEKIALNELQKMLLSGQRALLLKDGSLGVLGEEWLQQNASFIKHGKVKNNVLEVLRWMAVAADAATEYGAVMKKAIRDNWWKKWKKWQTGAPEVYPLAAGLKADLRPYQRKGYEWMLLMQEINAGVCLADDMGLGKTLQAIAAMLYYTEKHPSVKNIVVAPASLIYNWQQELEKFAPALQVMVYHGAGRQKEQIKEKNIQVIITTYSTMRSDADKLCEEQFGVAVIDESHNIKNPATQIAQAVMKMNALFRIALSGTPVVNNTFDLYTQLNFAVPGLFGSREFFKREYADPIDYRQDEEKITSLKKLTAPFVLRRTKEQVAKDLPEKTESILWCEMSGLQRNVYENILEKTRSSIFLDIKSNGLAKSKLSILQGMTRLRQACSSPVLLPEEEQQNCRESVKTQVLFEELMNITVDHKALVFSQFSSMLHLLAGECRKNGLAFYHFDGQTPPAKRVEMVNAFQQENNEVNVFLISLKAGNTGLTLTAADYVFLFDPWWNTAVEDQAIDRTHRIGQTKNVFAYKMICKDTIEEKIINLQQKKKKLSEDLVSADEGFVKSLTEEDVEYLFS
ncbi:MAG: DEAD/DEAH box helicase [Chitinophagaceae bacterium]|nr:DEAD/DEAH box helicase [Chitinophagaceae bacterium]